MSTVGTRPSAASPPILGASRRRRPGCGPTPTGATDGRRRLRQCSSARRCAAPVIDREAATSASLCCDRQACRASSHFDDASARPNVAADHALASMSERVWTARSPRPLSAPGPGRWAARVTRGTRTSISRRTGPALGATRPTIRTMQVGGQQQQPGAQVELDVDAHDRHQAVRVVVVRARGRARPASPAGS